MTNKSWMVYIVECADGTLYTGCTNDLELRITTHNDGKGAKYTRGRSPVTLRYSQACSSRSEAQQVEYQIKQLPVEEKQQLILSQNS